MAMTEAGQESIRDINAFAAGFFSGPMVDVVVRTTESYGKACLAWHEELLRFTAERLQRDSELGQALASTRNWADAAKLQQEWAASAIRDYTNETTRLFEIAADAGSKMTQGTMPQSVTSAAQDVGRMAANVARSTSETVRSASETAGEAADEVRAEARAEGGRPRSSRRTAPSTD